MRPEAPFQPEDLAEYDERLLSRASAVVAMEDIAGVAGGGPSEMYSNWTIGMRHDVDRDLETAVKLAAWEAERGYRSTYFLLHTADYWREPDFCFAVDAIAECGHEIGLHNNAIAAALTTGREPDRILTDAVFKLRSYGYPVRGVVGHGDRICYEANGGRPDGTPVFANDEIFLECARPAMGEPDRELTYNGDAIWLKPCSLADFGFGYESGRLPRAAYLSDSGGLWQPAFDEAVNAFPHPDGQLHALQHPCWWKEAFA